MRLKNRKLNKFEIALYKLNLAWPFNVLINIEIIGKITKKQIKEALVKIKQNNYYLNFFIQEEDNLKFIYTDNSIRFEIINYSSKRERIKLIQRELNSSSLYKDYPLAKLTILQNKNKTDLIFKVSHIISDGISAYNVGKELLEYINNIDNNVSSNSKEFKGLYPSLKFFPHWNLNNIPKANSIKKLKDIENYVNIDNRSTHIIERDLTIEESSELFAFCKQNQISVNSLLMACLVKNMVKKLKAERYGLVTLKTSSGLNLRQYYNCDVDNRVLGCWSGFGFLFYNLGDDIDLIDFSKRYQEDLKSYLYNNYSFLYLKLAIENYLNKSVRQIALDPPTKLPYVILTNLGKLNTNRIYTDKFTVKRISFTTSMHRNWINDLGFGICASTTNNQLNLNFNYMNPAWKQENAHKFVDSILDILKNLK